MTSFGLLRLLLILLTSVLFCAPAQAQSRRLTVVCSVQLEWCELVKREYEKTSGIRMAMIHRSSIDALAMLLAERHPQAGLAPAADDPRRADYLQWM